MNNQLVLYGFLILSLYTCFSYSDELSKDFLFSNFWSKKKLTVLNNESPLGVALWGVTEPDSFNDGFFWLQCGVFKNPKYSNSFTSPPRFDEPVINILGDHGYHCLIGPFSSFNSALLYGEGLVLKSGLDDFVLRALSETDAITLQRYNKFDIGFRLTLKQQEFIGLYDRQAPTAHQYNDGAYSWSRHSYKSALENCSLINAKLPSKEQFQTLTTNNTWSKLSSDIPLPFWLDDATSSYSKGENTATTLKSLLLNLCVRDVL